ncbi:ribokinase [Candidimonas sp. SYP-B2681]|uniref:ribokinase n=1 Tax=Candidimonas sp. SYP-B2681 TaxID=2497686 RepID=UPI000F89ADF1|nr:ribokinase [Candidimonas sp. SYP-B2681]RTZ47467.1 ribokinase [Candidimonas sp. SYP-B2681]
MSTTRPRIFVLGIYAADLVFTGSRMPAPGETVTASNFLRGHGGKGSNQAIAAARAGADVSFFTFIGDDAFGHDAVELWQHEGVRSKAVVIPTQATGAAGIFVDSRTGGNAITVFPGASRLMLPVDVDKVEPDIAESDVFVVQLEQPVDVARRGLELARRHRVTTILNPAPALSLPDDVFPLCDFILPNETEAGLLTGVSVGTFDEAERAARMLLKKGVGNVIITLGEKGALYCGPTQTFLVEPVGMGPCVDTTGAGDGFTAGFAVGLGKGLSLPEALKFAATLAGISVTRHGAAASMPTLTEIEVALK